MYVRQPLYIYSHIYNTLTETFAIFNNTENLTFYRYTEKTIFTVYLDSLYFPDLPLDGSLVKNMALKRMAGK